MIGDGQGGFCNDVDSKDRPRPRAGGGRSRLDRVFLQHVRQPGRGDQGAMGAGREPVAAPQRPDPEPGGDGERDRTAGAGRLRPHRRLAREARWRHDARTADAGGQRAKPALARLLVVVENYPQLRSNEQFARLDGRVVRHGEPPRGRADAIQRARAGLQHVAPAVPVEHHGVDLRLQGIHALRRAHRRPRRCRA